MISQKIVDDYSMNEDEIVFFEYLLRHSENLPGEYILNRLSSNTFNVFYGSIYLGKINLWKDPEKFAVIKEGAKRATRIFNDINEAQMYINDHSDDYHIEIRKAYNESYMQYSTSTLRVIELINPSLDKCLTTIPRWISYIKHWEKEDRKLDRIFANDFKQRKYIPNSQD